jgi:hypothetical protein
MRATGQQRKNPKKGTTTRIQKSPNLIINDLQKITVKTRKMAQIISDF